MLHSPTLFRTTLIASLLSTSAFAGNTGTDAFGNTITGSDVNPGVKSNLFFDISGQADQLEAGDDASAQNVDLGMTFRFYGQEYTALTFATNGYISTSATDVGRDFSNDEELPQRPSSGDGARIYAHHDDTEAVIFGGFFEAADNPFGVDAYIAQYDACHFGCTPGDDLTVQYNVALLADGTIIIAHNLAGPEEGSGATVGVQNETYDDGVAYLANEAGGIIDGQTIVVIPAESGLSTDIQNLAAEAGVTQAAALAASVASQLGGGGGPVVTQSANNPVERNYADAIAQFKPWLNTGVLHSKTGDDSTVETTALYVQGGIDLIQNENFIAGVGLAFATGTAKMGSATTDIGAQSIFLYGATDVAGWDVGTVLSYGTTQYDNLETAFLGDIDAEGERTTLSISATKNFDLGNALTLAPALSLMAGQEKIDDWAMGDDLTRSVEDIAFYKAEISGKLSRSIDAFGGGVGYVLGGVDYLSIEGESNDMTLFTTGYENERVGGVAGFGLEDLMIGGMLMSADFKASAITSDGYTINGSISLQF